MGQVSPLTSTLCLGYHRTTLNRCVRKESVMDDQDKALKKPGEGDIGEATPAEEPKPTEEVEEPVEETEPTGEVEAEGEATETDESPKKGFSNRVRELNTRAKEAEARATEAESNAQSLTDKLGELTGSVEPNATGQPYNPQVEPGAEISPDQYKQDVMRTADSIVQLRMKQQSIISKVNDEARESLTKHPELDPNSDVFDQELSKSVTVAVEAHVKAEPNPSVSKFVDRLMKPYKGAVAKEVGKMNESLAKQASQSAVKPTSVAKGDKDFGELSESEMEKKLGVIH